MSFSLVGKLSWHMGSKRNSSLLHKSCSSILQSKPKPTMRKGIQLAASRLETTVRKSTRDRQAGRVRNCPVSHGDLLFFGPAFSGESCWGKAMCPVLLLELLEGTFSLTWGAKGLKRQEAIPYCWHCFSIQRGQHGETFWSTFAL